MPIFSNLASTPRAISKIESINQVALTPPTGLATGKRVLIADALKGRHIGSIGTGAFAGKVGQIAISDGANGWTIEDSTNYKPDQQVLVTNSLESWYFSRIGAANNFVRISSNSIKTPLMLSYFHYYNGTQAMTSSPGYVLPMNTVQIMANDTSVTATDLQEVTGSGTYTKLPFDGVVTITGMVFVDSGANDQRLSLKLDTSTGVNKVNFGNFTANKSARGVNTTVATPVVAGDRAYLWTQDNMNYYRGLNHTEIRVTYLKLVLP